MARRPPRRRRRAARSRSASGATVTPAPARASLIVPVSQHLHRVDLVELGLVHPFGGTVEHLHAVLQSDDPVCRTPSRGATSWMLHRHGTPELRRHGLDEAHNLSGDLRIQRRTSARRAAGASGPASAPGRSRPAGAGRPTARRRACRRDPPGPPGTATATHARRRRAERRGKAWRRFPVYPRRPDSTLSMTLMRSMRLNSWKIMPMSRRIARRPRPRSDVTSRPWKRTLPPLGSTSLLMQRISVDLPAPLGPMMAKKSSASTSKEMPFRISGPASV